MWGYRIIGSHYVLRCSSIIVGECAFVRDCRGIGQMWVMCRAGILDSSARIVEKVGQGTKGRG
jgi:hypothetical protein